MRTWREVRNFALAPGGIYPDGCSPITHLFNMHLQILSSDFLIEMFDLRGKELKYRKDLLLNHYKKLLQSPMKLQNICGQCSL